MVILQEVLAVGEKWRPPYRGLATSDVSSAVFRLGQRGQRPRITVIR